MGLRDQAKSDRLERIRQAASDLLLDRSFNDVTTKDIAVRARVGEATLFRYIKSKQQLLTMVYGDRLDEVLDDIEAVDAVTAAGPDGKEVAGEQYVDRVLAAYKARCAFYLVDPLNATLYLREGFDPKTPESARHLDQGDRSIRLTAATLSAGQAAGRVRSDVDVTIVGQNCHGTYIHEIDRTSVRSYEPSTLWDRLRVRLGVQLTPLLIQPGRVEASVGIT